MSAWLLRSISIPHSYAVLAKLLLREKSLRIAVSINTTEFATRAEERQMLLYRWVLATGRRLVFGARYSARYFGADDTNCIAMRSGQLVLYNGVDTAYFDPADCAAR